MLVVWCNIYDFFFQRHPMALHSAPGTVSDKRKISVILRKKPIETHLPEPSNAQIHFEHFSMNY